MPGGFTLSLGGLEVRCAEPLDGATPVELRGELDSVSVPVLREALDRVFGAGASSLRIGMRGVSFIDSSGLGALVGAWRTCNGRGGTVEVVDPSEIVRQLLDLTGVSRLVTPGPG